MIIQQAKSTTDSLNTPSRPDVPKEHDLFEQMNISPIDLKQLKKRYENSFTSGMLVASRSKQFYRPNNKGFYGHYLLFSDLPDDGNLQGHIVVFNDNYPWFYDNDTDIFIELTAYNPNMVVFGDIHVGVSEQKLRAKFGRPDYDKDCVLLYIAKNRKLIAVFKITDNLIEWLKVGYYNDHILNNPEANIGILTQVISK